MLSSGYKLQGDERATHIITSYRDNQRSTTKNLKTITLSNVVKTYDTDLSPNYPGFTLNRYVMGMVAPSDHSTKLFVSIDPHLSLPHVTLLTCHAHLFEEALAAASSKGTSSFRPLSFWSYSTMATSSSTADWRSALLTK